MTDIRYVILSDLHFGAENSVMTALTERPATASDTGFSADPQRPSESSIVAPRLHIRESTASFAPDAARLLTVSARPR